MRSEEVLLKPVITEKSTERREKENKYVFVVDKMANKIMVKDAVEELYNVKPLKVNIINIKGKRKRVRYKYGYTTSYKKAIVKLRKGEKIAIFEGAW